MSPFLTAFVGGIAGGAAFGLAVVVLAALFGRRLAEQFFQGQVAYIEQRFKDKILDAVLARVAGFLDQTERIGQIARRVVEIVQLVMRKAPLESPAPGGEPLGASALSQGHSTLGAALQALGRNDDARRSFEEALRLDPRDPRALQGLRELGAPAK